MCTHLGGNLAVRVGIRELRAQLAFQLESATPIEVTRHGRTIGLYVPLPQHGGQEDQERLLEAGRLMQAELVRLGLDEERLSADFKVWRERSHRPDEA
ncbi:MAG: prevent-host-death protein [Cyanobacteria bacterium K_DeepCast_35m_m2_023]|nr:prevent-host-death protein [Cyanobacteria bacterium K_DeepCast_35m_m2_023]